ncbi:MAG: dihydroorotate dehydrogenase [Mycolicibacterium sp.]|nr:dihydroorotate dehydrogenase [Mycolicibacterium sp.]
MSTVQRGRMPVGWAADLSDEYDWVPLRLPPDVTRLSASVRLSIEAQYRGWELTRVRLYTDGSRRVLLRRKKSVLGDQPAL